MQLFSRKEIYIWVLGALLVLNLATLGTILWKHSKSGSWKHCETSEKHKSKDRQHGTVHWLKEMGLSEEAIGQLRTIRDDFKESSSFYFGEIAEYEKEIFEQMSTSEPDTVRLLAIADSIGILHSAVRKESIRHLLEIKKITTPEQFKMLNERMQNRMMRQGWQHREGHDKKSKKFDCSKEHRPERCTNP